MTGGGARMKIGKKRRAVTRGIAAVAKHRAEPKMLLRIGFDAEHAPSLRSVIANASGMLPDQEKEPRRH
jgi:hypothetical protein